MPAMRGSTQRLSSSRHEQQGKFSSTPRTARQDFEARFPGIPQHMSSACAASEGPCHGVVKRSNGGSKQASGNSEKPPSVKQIKHKEPCFVVSAYSFGPCLASDPLLLAPRLMLILLRQG